MINTIKSIQISVVTLLKQNLNKQYLLSKLDFHLVPRRLHSKKMENVKKDYKKRKAEDEDNVEQCRKKAPMIPKTFSFTDYDVIGFDLDNCLCRYNLRELYNLEYDLLSTYIINRNTLPQEFLQIPYEEGQDFVIKGLILDLNRGNVLRISADGTIIQASHGTQPLSSRELLLNYPGAHWSLTDKYAHDPLSVWLGKPATQIQALTDYFDLPVALVYARIIDNIDKTLGKKSDNYNIFPEILNALHDMYDYEQFETRKGGFYSSLQDYPDKYIFQNENYVINWLENFKKAGKLLFLLTGSNVDCASFTAENSIGPKWKQLFDIKVYKARKPGFWSLNRSFKKQENGQLSTVNNLRLGEEYYEGNYDELKNFFCNVTGKSDPKVVYIGDSIIQDVYAPHRYCALDTVAVVEELAAEGVFGFKSTEEDYAKLLNSKYWGSFFMHTKTDNSDTLWKNLIMKHSKFWAPSINVLAEKPIDYKFTFFDF